MEQIVEILAWPCVVLVIALVAITKFRTDLANLIQRTKRLSKTGLETYEAQPSQPRDEKKAIDEFLCTFDNPLLLEGEQLILKELKERKLENAPDREKALVRSLASAHIIHQFERVYGLLWAKQVALLRFLNAREEGADVADLLVFYETGKTDFPALHENYPFDKWLGFLESVNFIAKHDSRVFISVAGREFLKYLVVTGKPGPSYG